jgi:hypothetical protein
MVVHQGCDLVPGPSIYLVKPPKFHEEVLFSFGPEPIAPEGGWHDGYVLNASELVVVSRLVCLGVCQICE